MALLYNSPTFRSGGVKIRQLGQTSGDTVDVIIEDNAVTARRSYHNHPERTAWIVTLGSLVILCSLLGGVLWGGRWYLNTAKDRLTTNVASIGGTVLVRSGETASPLAILPNSQMVVDQATIVSTDEGSQAVLTFFEESTITLYGNTTLVIHASNRPRFRWSKALPRIEIEILSGRIRATPAKGHDQLTFVIRTPHAETTLSQGSYAVEANNELTQVTVREGAATVSSQGNTVALQKGERSAIPQNQPPSEATAAEQDLVHNGDFSDNSLAGWESDIFVPDNAQGRVNATVSLDRIDGRFVVLLKSTGEDNIHTDAAIEQQINKDVQDFQSLRINVDIQLNEQSLPGGGFQGSEFPILIKLSYKDAEGNDRDWYRGFYYATPPGNYILYDQVDNASEQISRNLWYPYESENLLATLGDIKPVYVKSIRIYASGWLYDSMVTNVQLLAQD